MIPHITDEIKARIRRNAEDSSADIAHRGDRRPRSATSRGLPFLEAIRQFRKDVWDHERDVRPRHADRQRRPLG